MKRPKSRKRRKHKFSTGPDGEIGRSGNVWRDPNVTHLFWWQPRLHRKQSEFLSTGYLCTKNILAFPALVTNEGLLRNICRKIELKTEDMWHVSCGFKGTIFFGRRRNNILTLIKTNHPVIHLGVMFTIFLSVCFANVYSSNSILASP